MNPNESVTVTHNEREHRFETEMDGHLAIAEYTLLGNLITFTHTIVPGAIEGQGVGAALAREALRFAEERNLQIIAQCAYIAAYMQRHGIRGEAA